MLEAKLPWSGSAGVWRPPIMDGISHISRFSAYSAQKDTRGLQDSRMFRFGRADFSYKGSRHISYRARVTSETSCKIPRLRNGVKSYRFYGLGHTC